MAYINKSKYIHDISVLVGKRGVSFDMERRPVLEVGGRKAFVKDVGYDAERGEMTFSLCDDRGLVYPTSRGARPLSSLDVRTLKSVSDEVIVAVGMNEKRALNLMRIEARLVEAMNAQRKRGVVMKTGISL